MSKEDFIKKYGDSPLYEIIRNSKMGDIEIEKVVDSPLDEVKMKGITPGFSEGMSCYIEDNDRYYYTSTIQSIDWENNIFRTLNSDYKFKFNERDITSEIQEIAG